MRLRAGGKAARPWLTLARVTGRRADLAAAEEVPATRQRVLDEIRAQMVALDLAPRDVDPAATLVDDLAFDSLDWLDLTLHLEERLGIALREEKLASTRTVGDVVECVLQALAARGS